MKRIFTVIAAFALIVLGAKAISLNDAYNEMAKLPGVVERTGIQNIKGINATVLDDIRAMISADENSFEDQSQYRANQFDAIVRQIAISSMAVGAANSQVTGLVYVAPNEMGRYDVLILTSLQDGTLVAAVAGTTDEEGMKRIKASSVTLEGTHLSIKCPGQQPVYLINI